MKNMDSFEADIVARYQGGEEIDSVADAMRCTKHAVRQALKAAGVALREQGPRVRKLPRLMSRVLKELPDQLQKDKSLKVAAKHFKCSVTTVLRAAIQLGLVKKRTRKSDLPKTIADAYKDGASLASLAKDHTCSIGTVRARLVELGVTIRKCGGSAEDSPPYIDVGGGSTDLPAADIQDIVSSYKVGASVAFIARKYARAPYSIRKILKTEGVELRKRHARS